MNLRRRLSTLIAVRVVISTLLLGWAIIIQLGQPEAFRGDPLFLLIGLTYALSVLYFATLRFAERHLWLVDLQLAADALIVSAFIHITGGITSYFSSLYLLPIMAASMVRFGRGARQVAALSAILYLTLVSTQYVEPEYLPALLRPTRVVELPTLRIAQFTVAINLVAFVAVAWLSGWLAESLRSAGARLAVASHEIEDLRAFNEYVIDSLLSGLASTDAEGRVLTFNRAASAITGIPAHEAIGGDVAAPLQLPPHFRARLGTLGSGRSLRVDLVYHRRDGRVIDLGISAATMTFPDGRAGYLFTFQDVTAIRRLERDSRLQQRLAAVGEMAAGIAHEIRNPLASMSGSIQVLREELPLTEEQAQLMDIVLRESERLNQTIGSFLAYARPERFAIARLDLRRILSDAAVLLRNRADVQAGHVIDLEGPDTPVWYEADENQIRQIVWNLATNGLRAMKDGGRLSLSVRYEDDSAEPGDVVLTVRDEGCGIPADELDTIFQPFHSSFEKGTGLGLAIVHRIVSDYSGTIDVSSTVGRGTAVHVHLPVRDRLTPDPAPQPAPRKAAV